MNPETCVRCGLTIHDTHPDRPGLCAHCAAIEERASQIVERERAALRQQQEEQRTR